MKSATETIRDGRTDTRVCCQVKGYKEDTSPSMLLDNKLKKKKNYLYIKLSIQIKLYSFKLSYI